MRDDLRPLLGLAQTLPPEELPEFLGSIEQIRVSALVRLTTPAVALPPDLSLSIKQASKRLGVSCDYLYRHWREFKFARQEGRKVLFSSNGLDSYLKKSRN